MGRILHIAPTRPGGAAHWAKVGAVVLLAVAAGIGLARFARLGDDTARAAAAPSRSEPALAPAAAAPAPPAAVPAPTVAAAATPPVSCPIQAMQLALDGAPPRTVCMAATLLQQTGSVRTFDVRAGDAEGWALRIDMADRSVMKVQLTARDGRTYACEAPGCAGRVEVVPPAAAGAGRIAVQDLRLAPSSVARPPAAAVPAGAVLQASLRVPPDEQVPGLACTGPSATLASASGAAHRFCGQGGAGVEIADDGQRIYRFQDHEGRTLAITVGAEQRVVGVTWDGHACRGAACSGASTTSADPADDLAERSFHFGRTRLVEAGANAAAGGGRPPLILDGTLVMPAQ